MGRATTIALKAICSVTARGLLDVGYAVENTRQGIESSRVILAAQRVQARIQHMTGDASAIRNTYRILL